MANWSRTDPASDITIRLEFTERGEAIAKAYAPGRPEVTVRWTVRTGPHGGLMFHLPQVHSSITCIALCLGRTIGGALMDCLLNNTDGLKGIEKCLDAKAVGILTDTGVCVQRCLANAR